MLENRKHGGVDRQQQLWQRHGEDQRKGHDRDGRAQRTKGGLFGQKRGDEEDDDDPDDEPQLKYIEDDSVYEAVADAFDEFLDKQEYDEIITEEEE